jgi:tRNA pseudouridine38-40 synthase
LHEDILHHTAAIIKATTQFESFAKRNSQVKTMNCTIHESRWEHVGNELHYVVVGNRFLRGMVRGLVGTQLNIARGNKTVADFQQIVEAQNCTKAFFNVPGHGLYLEHIGYPDGALVDLMTR